MAVVYVHIQVDLKIVICSQQVSAFLIKRLPVHCVDIKQQTDVLSVLKLLLEAFSITHCNEVFIFIWWWSFLVDFWRLTRADKWWGVKVLRSKRNLQLVTRFNDFDAWIEEALDRAVKRLDVINAVILRLESDYLIPEAEDFLKPVGHPLIESLLGFYLDFFHLIFEFERYHLWAFNFYMDRLLNKQNWNTMIKQLFS